jgi:Predicted oxidoreductases (related to aryl-alcohol dehydrogenases)
MRGPLRLLEAAFDAGIRHFDTAPLYGLGSAERCFGEFLARHKAQVTIATKYGLLPPRMGKATRLVRGLARPLLTVAPGLKERLMRSKSSSTAAEIVPEYSVEAARTSLENSLRELRTDHIPLWLLHEATAESLQDEGLLRFLEDSVKLGKIGAFGVGGAAAKMPEIYAKCRAFCPVMQCGWDALETDDHYPGTFKSRFQILRFWPARIAAYLKEHPAIMRVWSDEVGIDLSLRDKLNRLMLRTALRSNPDGLILFESRSEKNIAENAAVAADEAIDDPAARFLMLLRREAHQIARC